MFTILWWILSVILDSISTSNRKKAYDNTTLSKWLFKLFAKFFWFFIIFSLVFIRWFDFEIFRNYADLLLILLIVIIGIINTYLHLNIIKKSKLSELLPYDNLDKLFIIIIWFFLFQWTDKWVSLVTLFIIIFTLILILFFSVDIKNIKLPKNIWLFVIHKWIKAWKILLIWILLQTYLSTTFIAIDWVYEFSIYLIILYISKDSPVKLFQQSKSFYINRITATFTWRGALIIWLIIIKESGIIIATLLWFLWLAFNIFSMKIILDDSPTKKQILLAFIVIFLIWIWYYLK